MKNVIIVDNIPCVVLATCPFDRCIKKVLKGQKIIFVIKQKFSLPKNKWYWYDISHIVDGNQLHEYFSNLKSRWIRNNK